MLLFSFSFIPILSRLFYISAVKFNLYIDGAQIYVSITLPLTPDLIVQLSIW